MYKERYVALFEDLYSKNDKVIKQNIKTFIQDFLRPFKPDTSYKTTWDLLGMLFIFVQMITIPLIITFSIELDLFYDICNQIMDYYFLIDILVSFHTSYYYKKSYLFFQLLHMLILLSQSNYWLFSIQDNNYSFENV